LKKAAAMDRRFLLAGTGAFLIGSPLHAQQIGDVLRSAAGQSGNSKGLPNGVTRSDAESGLRQALTNGAIAAVLKVGRLDGFWADSAIQIPLPGALGDIQRNLKPLGLSKPLDDLQLRINRGAEAAAPKARDLFGKAIRSMTVEDVVGILRGGDSAGTTFLRQKTEQELTAQFRPSIADALAKSGALRAFERAAGQYGAASFNGVTPRDTLISFAVTKALDGVFHYVAIEERAIRSNPAKRTSDILRRVFGPL
jgi:hypothetical protein